MLEFFRDGGVGMFLTLFVGVAFVVVALRTRAEDARGRARLLGLGSLTLLSGATNFVVGIHLSLAAAGEAGVVNLAMLGAAESLNNLTLAFVLLGAGVAVRTARAFRGDGVPA